MEEISKTRMELAIKNLERRAAQIDDVPMFRGIPVTAFDKEHLVMLCSVFAEEYRKYKARYFEALDKPLISYVAGATVAAEFFYKPPIWKKIWNRVKSWA